MSQSRRDIFLGEQMCSRQKEKGKGEFAEELAITGPQQIE
jgi:hypothetical protein